MPVNASSSPRSTTKVLAFLPASGGKLLERLLLNLVSLNSVLVLVALILLLYFRRQVHSIRGLGHKACCLSRC